VPAPYPLCSSSWKDLDCLFTTILPAVQELLELRLIHPVSGLHRRTGPDEGAVLMLDAGVCLECNIPVPFEEECPVKLNEAPLFSGISG
jgi:hypothetical protein